ncbi:DUF2332 domain-containing protein [Thermoactinomyces mirandus]|uniref:DUF2332 domain-containing protein n=1 Tax=Thermoactinomyces mirandus TaxID=2756294 RepID=A0A7W2ATD3_9BACL|nr:DUF2332 domain-containing protein [Thermoactinomyces mirandus]MBA4603635.1 DUF2332 domain-containing protein [Thermoactinomyces mirandus]
MKKESLSHLFRNFALNECKNSSILYGHLALNISEDKELLEIALHARSGQPVPNLFLGAVHYLLLKGKNHELRKYYPGIVDYPQKAEYSFPYFRDFCLSFREEIISILQEKLVQTNEIGRCAYLYPCFCLIYSRVKKPLSDILIHADIKGKRKPFLLPESPPVSMRLGIDLKVNNLSDEEDYLWLRSLIWPEHKKRVELFEKAARLLPSYSLRLIKGDGVLLLPQLVKQIPKDRAICIFHTHVANQIREKDKLELMKQIQSLGKTKEVFHLYNNMWDGDLHLDSFIDGEKYHRILARTDGHGRWFEWYSQNKGNRDPE